jgi:hypothetical protein
LPPEALSSLEGPVSLPGPPGEELSSPNEDVPPLLPTAPAFAVPPEPMVIVTPAKPHRRAVSFNRHISSASSKAPRQCCREKFYSRIPLISGDYLMIQTSPLHFMRKHPKIRRQKLENTVLFIDR